MAHIGQTVEDFNVGQCSGIPLTGTEADMGNTFFRLFTLNPRPPQAVRSAADFSAGFVVMDDVAIS